MNDSRSIWLVCTTKMNLSLRGRVVMPFMDRMLSRACTASARVNSVCVRMLILAPGRLAGRSTVRSESIW